MRCKEFLRAYSDYRDGLIADTGVIRRVHEHLAGCDRCRRYDRTIVRGVSTLRAARVDPDPEVAARLQALATPEGFAPPFPAHASVFAAVLVVAAFALIARDGVRGTPPVAPEAEPAAAAVAASLPPVVVANPGVPFVRFAVFAAASERATAPASLAPVASSLTLYQGAPHR